MERCGREPPPGPRTVISIRLEPVAGEVRGEAEEPGRSGGEVKGEADVGPPAGDVEESFLEHQDRALQDLFAGLEHADGRARE